MSDIEWTGETWNPLVGCSRISPGCGGNHPTAGPGGGCYAERQAYRLEHAFKQPQYQGTTRMTEDGPRWTGQINLVPGRLEEPLSWRKPRRVFVDSMSDLFHKGVPFAFVAAVFGVMAQASQHTFQVLTKRPDRMRAWFKWLDAQAAGPHSPDRAFIVRTIACNHGAEGVDQGAGNPWPLPNVWLGTSVESQEYADARVPDLLATPAAVRFISVEPLLGPVDLSYFFRRRCPACEPLRCIETDAAWWRDCPTCAARPNDLHWVIAGSESGRRARPMEEAWVRALRDQCAGAGVSFFYKQRLEGRRKVSLPVLDGRQWAEFPGVSNAG